MQNKEVENLLRDHEPRHSDFQIENFIIGGQGDKWAQYKQCLREMSTRYESLVNADQKLKLAEIVVKKIKRKIFIFPSNKRKLYLRAKIDLINAKENIKKMKPELDCILKKARELKKEIGPISNGRRYELETKSWQSKGLKMSAIDILSTGRISNQTYEFLFSLPKKSQLEIFHKLKDNPPMKLLGFESDEIRAISNQ